MKKLFLVFFLNLLLKTIFCQLPEINYDHLAVQEGLSDNSINCVIQDHTGFIWIGGNNGLYKYDGYDFTPIKVKGDCRTCPSFRKVFTLREDNNGLLWILSDDGIVLFDPETERSTLVYQVAWDSSHIKSELNNGMALDSHGNIWVVNQTGVINISFNKSYLTQSTGSIFNNSHTDLFNIDQIQIGSEKYGLENRALSIYKDLQENIWAGSVKGIYLKKSGSNTFIRLDGNSADKVPGLQMVTGILQIDENSFLIISDNNLWQLSHVKEEFNKNTIGNPLFHFAKVKMKAGEKALSIYKDRKNNCLLGTGKDLYKLKRNDKTGDIIFESIHQGHTNDDADFKQIISIYEDRTEVFWASHPDNGLSRFTLSQPQFTSYNNIISNELKNTDINSVLKDKEGNLWIGAYGSGLYRIIPESHRVTRYESAITRNRINCIREESAGIFLIGLYPGILEFDSHTGKFSDPLPHSKTSDNLKAAGVIDLLEDNDKFYIVTMSGLFIYYTKNKQLFQYTFSNNDSLIDFSNAISAVIKLRSGEILISSCYHGINKVDFNPLTGDISLSTIISNKLLTENGIIDVERHRLFEDSNGLLWIGNYSGLHSIDPKDKKIKNYTLFENIEFPQISSIEEDNHNNLWMGTHKGLCRFNTKTGSVRVFDKNDGLPVSVHGFNSVCKANDGRLFFGGVGGFYSFSPDSIENNISEPPVLITDFRISNKSVTPDTSEHGILRKSIPYTHLIKLTHNQNDISFHFAAMDFNQPLKNKYSYKLKGYQDEWIRTDANNRVAGYTGLHPGTYTFMVKGSNNEGVWNEKGASLTIIIQRPWWTTFSAWVIYVIVFLSVTGGLIYFRLSKLKKEKLVLENLVSERTHMIEEQKEEIMIQNKKILELDELKSHFFTNVSHEFRTPLTLIQSPVQELLDDPHRSVKEKRILSMVQRNTRRLIRLVNQLLDISKIDMSKMKLELFEDDVMKHLKFVAESFSALAETNSIRYHLNFSREEMATWFDPDKLDKIVVNLLSNAFKFTPEGGVVSLNAGYSKSEHGISDILRFSVSDTGRGIPTDSLEKIFDRFYQVDSSLKKDGEGTGIGLSLSRELALLMHGNISVESEEHKGSTFHVMIPLGKNHLSESEFKVLNSFPPTSEFYHDSHGKNGIGPSDRESKSDDENPVLLIIEDNQDVRMHLAENFNSEYIVHQAIDGISGLKKAMEFIPDIIVTDLMMPGMSGLELCERLRNDERTSHIPIIMLTAKVTNEDKITGLQTGADDYIAKPFSMAELKVRVKNLIEQRKRLRDRFSREITLEPSEISITPLDEKFLNKAIELVEKNIKEENFDLAGLRNGMNMSRSTLFRKLHALTGQSPTEFIRTIRLKRAASLLKQNFGNVTQVAMEAGFNNLSYFNRTFKKLFGVSPVDYAKNKSDKKGSQV